MPNNRETLVQLATDFVEAFNKVKGARFIIVRPLSNKPDIFMKLTEGLKIK